MATEREAAKDIIKEAIFESSLDNLRHHEYISPEDFAPLKERIINSLLAHYPNTTNESKRQNLRQGLFIKKREEPVTTKTPAELLPEFVKKFLGENEPQQLRVEIFSLVYDFLLNEEDLISRADQLYDWAINTEKLANKKDAAGRLLAYECSSRFGRLDKCLQFARESEDPYRIISHLFCRYKLSRNEEDKRAILNLLDSVITPKDPYACRNYCEELAKVGLLEKAESVADSILEPITSGQAYTGILGITNANYLQKKDILVRVSRKALAVQEPNSHITSMVLAHAIHHLPPVETKTAVGLLLRDKKELANILTKEKSLVDLKGVPPLLLANLLYVLAGNMAHITPYDVGELRQALADKNRGLFDIMVNEILKGDIRKVDKVLLLLKAGRTNDAATLIKTLTYLERDTVSHYL